jgi:N utilization substance protein B
MLFAADMVRDPSDFAAESYWHELGDSDLDDRLRAFANKLVNGTLGNIAALDDKIRTRAEHWRIERMAIVDRNVLRLAVYEFLFEDTPHTVVINEALEIARRFSTFEATQFINGILDAIKLDLQREAEGDAPAPNTRSQASSN